MKKYKGFTIIETMIAMTVLFVLSVSVYTICLSATSSISRQEAYCEFNSIFADMDTFHKRYQDSWNLYYFGDTGEEGTHYYDANFNEVKSESIAFYSLNYKKTSDGIVVDVYDLDANEQIFTNYTITFHLSS